VIAYAAELGTGLPHSFASDSHERLPAANVGGQVVLHIIIHFKQGGIGYWSDAIYKLTSFARANGTKYVLMDWDSEISFLFFQTGASDMRSCLQ
jgi:hypothetical protein